MLWIIMENSGENNRKGLVSLVKEQGISHHHILEELNHPNRFTQEDLNSSLHHVATKLGNLQITKALLSYGADLKVLNEKGAPLLIGVVIGGHLDVLQCLLEFGYDVNYQIGDTSETGLGIPLHIAIWKNDIAMVELLLQAKCRTDFVDGEGNNALMTACMEGSVEIFRLILQSPFFSNPDTVNLQNYQGENALHLAVKHYNPQIIHEMITIEGLDVNVQNENGDTALLLAGKMNLSDVLEILLSSPRCHPNIQNNDGSRLIHVIAPYATIDFMTKWEKKLDPQLELIDNYGNTAGTVAACYNNQPLVMYFINVMDDIEKPDTDILDQKGFLGRTLLHWVVINSMRDVMNLLKELYFVSVDFNTQDEEGNTPLMLACKHRALWHLKSLVQSHAEVNIVNNEGKSALHLLCEAGYDELLTELLDNKPNMAQLTPQSETALLLAVKNNHYIIVKQLFKCREVHKYLIDIADHSGMTVLHHAVISDNIDIVEFLLHNECTSLINSADKTDNTPLTLAAKNNVQFDIVNALLMRRADPNVLDGESKSPLFYRVCSGDLAAVRSLLEAEAYTELDKCGSTVLIESCKRGYSEIFNLLLDEHADVNSTDHYNRTALTWACQKGYLEMARELVARGCDAKHADVSGDTALTTAAYEGHLDVVNFILPVSDIDHTEDEEGMSALLLALSAGHTDVAELLIQTGANVKSSAKNNGNSVLITAVAMEAGLDIVKLILDTDRRLEINFRGEMGRTVAHWAIAFEDILRKLLEYPVKIDLDVVDDNGATPLLLAIAHSRPESALVLLNSGCAYELIHSDGRQPIHHACVYGESKVLEKLLSMNVDVETLTEDGRSPLLLACIEGHTECVQLLLDHSAKVNNVFFDAITPLSVAVNGSHHNTMEVLLRRGAYPDLIGSKKPRPIICAIVKDDLSAVRMLLQWGSDTEQCPDINSHPVTVASLKHRTSVLSLLLTALADTNVVREILKAGAVYYFIQDQGIRDTLHGFIQFPVPLQQLCRSVLRKCVPIPVRTNIQTLSIPVMIKHYLLFIKE